MMRIGLVNVDRTNFPNLALGKISAYHKSRGDAVEWADPMFGDYDKVYMSKIFTFSPEYPYSFTCEVERGGSGYDLHKDLPYYIDKLQPDYSIFPQVDDNTAYGFITRGCIRKCSWCVVPKKEGYVKPYMDVDEISIDGIRCNLILMDNNILASDYGLEQIEKIIKRRYRIDLNQANDARLVTDDVAKMFAQVHWGAEIKFGCDTPKQVEECERAMTLIDRYSDKPKHYLLFTMLHGNIEECYERTSFFRNNKRVRIAAQPYRDFNDSRQIIPQWQKDMARWSLRRELWTTCDFKDFSPRKNFTCKEYFK